MDLAGTMRWMRRLAGPVECLEVRLLGWSILSVLFRQQVLVLETTGRRSGKRRRTTVAYKEVDGQLIVVGGAGGQPRPPDWVLNLQADPLVGVTRRRERSTMSAHVLEGADRDQVWRALAATWPIVVKYQDRAGYDIPVVRLTAD